MTVDPAIIAAASLAIGGLFVAAALHKLSDFRRFVGIVRAHRVVADDLAPTAAVLNIAAEAIFGVQALLVGTGIHRFGIAGCAALLVFYAVLILFNITRGNSQIDCGCLGFTAKRPRLTHGLAGRNAVLLVLAGVSVLPANARPLTWLDYVAIAGSIVMFALIYAGADLALALPKKKELA